MKFGKYRTFDGTRFVTEASCQSKKRARQVAHHVRQDGKRGARIIKTGKRYVVFREAG